MKPNREMLAFDRTFKSLWFLKRGEFWLDCVDFEHRQSTESTGFYVGWDKVELEDIPKNDRDRFFVPVPAWFHERSNG